MAVGIVRQYVVLFIDPGTGEIEVHGPVDEPRAVELAGEFRAALAADAELREVGVLILQVQPVAHRSVAAPRPLAGR
jgi:hypothetical protein